MTFLQRVLSRLLPRDAADNMRTESCRWLVRCLDCSFERSVWDFGGMDHRVIQKGKRVVIEDYENHLS